MNILFQFLGRITVEENIVLTSFIMLSMFIGMGLGVYICWYRLRWAAAKNWICVNGYIIEFKEIENSYGSGIPKIRICYGYSINGIKFEQTKYQLGVHRDRQINIELVQYLRAANAAGSAIKVLVDPSRPIKSSLNIDFDKQGIAVLIGIALLALFPLIIFGLS